MGEYPGGKEGEPKPSLWDTEPKEESSLPMITSSAIELIEDSPSQGAVLIEHPEPPDPAEKKFFDTSLPSETETQIGTSSGTSFSSLSSSSLGDRLVLAGVRPRNRLLPWLLFFLSISLAGAAWIEVVKPRFEALDQADGKLAAAAKDLSESQSKIAGLENKVIGLETEKAVLVAEREKLGSAQEAMEAKAKALAELAERLRVAFANEKRVEVEVLEDAVVLRMTTDDLFVFGDVTLKDAAFLDLIGGVLKGQGEHRLTVAAHTDSTPVPGKLRARFPSNYELSAARALAVLHQLETHKLGDQIEITAAGATRPIASNKTQPGRRKNRRIEILIH